MLAQQLRELERDGVINRTVYPQVPPKVEYSMTPLGDALGPMLETMHTRGARIISRHAAAKPEVRRPPAAAGSIVSTRSGRASSARSR
jgi:DNA-binding HxlR family transcriptional regulator